MLVKRILYCAACYGLFLLASPSLCFGQEGEVKPGTNPLTSTSALVDGVFDLIANIELAKRGLKDPRYNEIEVVRVNSFLRYRTTFTKALLDANISMKVEIDKLIALHLQELDRVEKAAIEQGSPLIQSMTILDELGRNCLMEKQKLQWEAAIEEIKSEADKKRAEKNQEVAKFRLASQELAVEGLRGKLDAAKESLEEMMRLSEKGAANKSDVRKALQAVKEIESELRIVIINFKIADLEFELQNDSSLDTRALNRLSLGERSKLLDQQLKQLAEQRKLTSKSLSIQARIASDTNRALEVERKIEQLQSELESYKMLQEKLDSALKELNQKEAIQASESESPK